MGCPCTVSCPCAVGRPAPAASFIHSLPASPLSLSHTLSMRCLASGANIRVGQPAEPAEPALCGTTPLLVAQAASPHQALKPCHGAVFTKRQMCGWQGHVRHEAKRRGLAATRQPAEEGGGKARRQMMKEDVGG